MKTGHFCILIVSMMLSTSTIWASETVHPLDSMVGVRLQTGTFHLGEQKIPISSSVKCSPTSTKNVVLCHGSNGPDFSWLDTFDWSLQSGTMTKTSLATVPGQGITVLKGTWNETNRSWTLKGTRQNNDGTITQIRTTRQISPQGVHTFHFFEIRAGQDVLVFEITETPTR